MTSENSVELASDRDARNQYDADRNAYLQGAMDEYRAADSALLKMSAGGLALTVTIAQHLVADPEPWTRWALVISWLGFVASIGAVIQSNRRSASAHDALASGCDAIWSRYEQGQGVEEEEEQQRRRADTLSRGVRWWNACAGLGALVGAVGFVVFLGANYLFAS